jgi:sulfite reductase (ferredoxin)
MKDVKPFYTIPDKVKDDIELYRLEVDRFNRGEISAGRLRPFRVARGIYAQRGQEKFMVRIKVAGGGLTPDQMTGIADMSEKYGNGIPHVTTRQDMQLHYVPLDDTVKAIEGLLEVGLTTRGGGGNTVRNITACYNAGVCDREVFDVSPYAPAFTEFFLNHPKSFNLPRKFKISFSGCSEDCSLATINDVGFIAKKKVIDGVERRGFTVYAAGGMGAKSRVADKIEDFVLEEEALDIAEAIMILFDKYGNRKNKHKARLRFVIDKVGRDEFMRLYREELAAVKAAGPKEIDLSERNAPQKEELAGNNGIPAVKDTGFERWRQTNVTPQKQNGYFAAKIRIPLGDISADDYRKLADIVRRFGEGTIRTTHDQNILLRWLSGEEIYPFYEALVDLGFSKPCAGGTTDILSCPGASTCNLGICLPKNFAVVLTDELEETGIPFETMPDVRIMLNGCQNACAQHPIGPIGLHGAARRGSGKMAPHYNILLGGRVEEGKTILGEEFGFVPAKKVNTLLTTFLKEYHQHREEGEDFYAYLDRRGKARMRDMVKEYPLPAYEEDKECFKDWGVDEEFSLAGLGPGECGAGILDIIEADIDDAKRFIYKAGDDISKGHLDKASEALARALGHTTKSILVTKGIEPTDEYVSVTEFEKNFIRTGLVPERFNNLKMRWARYLSELLDAEGLKKETAFMEELCSTVAELYAGMDNDMKFKGEKSAEVKKEEPKVAAPSEAKAASASGTDATMDLRGVKCPINYVKAKIKLETMTVGQTLGLLLDDGEPIRNVPTSLKNDGQEIIKMEQVGEYYDLIVKKVA